MWSHYANYHKGFCIEYDTSKSELFEKYMLPIIYKKDRYDATKCFLTKNKNIGVNPVLYKSNVWEYEKEWRIIRDQNACGDRWDETKRGALLDMVQPISITVGCAATAAFEEQIRENCRERGIRLYKMEKDPTNFRLNKRIILK